ncbi:MAG TPA: hypothetical protein VKG44_06145, partial [Candidatus Baltobacteraceae bacterium]|nr:hypothetical protein [Candidatus Baltobacteraceae bacterium]
MASLTAERQFVRSDPDVLRRALVVRPTHEVEQVPPVQGEPSPIADRALDEFEVLIRRLRGAGVETTVYDGETAHPLACAAADIAVVLQHGAVMMRPSDLSRHREVSAMEDVFGKLGIPVIGRIDTPG